MNSKVCLLCRKPVKSRCAVDRIKSIRLKWLLHKICMEHLKILIRFKFLPNIAA